MAAGGEDKVVQSSTVPAVAVDENEKLLRRSVEVTMRIDEAIKSRNNGTREGKDLENLSHVLEKIKTRLALAIPPRQGFPEESKREELDILLKEINGALHHLLLTKQPQPQPEETQQQQQRPDPVVLSKKKLLSAAMRYYYHPFRNNKLTSSGGGGRRRPTQEEDEEGVEEEDHHHDHQAVSSVSLKLLVRLAQHVLEPEQYYEWTTSYVDESRIYGWDEDAGRVGDALVDDGGDFFFRAAAITGIHGSGKTALAQKVFAHDRVKDHFPVRLWVCVGPPDSEDHRFNLLYRMLDNLGLDTARVEDVVVDGASVVRKKREEVARKIPEEELERMRKEAAAEMAKKRTAAATAADVGDVALMKKMEEAEFHKLLKQKTDSCLAVQESKIGVLLYILHRTLSKTGYLIVFDDIRAYGNGNDGWYNNLALPPPLHQPDREWGDRLAYGLPKSTSTSPHNNKHRHRNAAVLVTCRKEDDARAMVRTGRVFRPPPLQVDNGWKLFEREYKQAKKEQDNKDDGNVGGGEKEDLLFKELAEMKSEIVKKCLGLPVAIIEAAKGFACSGLEPLPDHPLVVDKAASAAAAEEDDQIGSSNSNKQDGTHQTDEEELIFERKKKSIKDLKRRALNPSTN